VVKSLLTRENHVPAHTTVKLHNGGTLGESSSEYGTYTEAYRRREGGRRRRTAVVPPLSGREGHPQWCLYFASQDAAATAARVREAGGEVLM
jgi:predicted enzyme related to lactoylglutathione lyase